MLLEGKRMKKTGVSGPRDHGPGGCIDRHTRTPLQTHSPKCRPGERSLGPLLVLQQCEEKAKRCEHNDLANDSVQYVESADRDNTTNRNASRNYKNVKTKGNLLNHHLSLWKSPKPNRKMIRHIYGFAFCFFWFFSIFAGFFVLICPALPLVLLAPKTYRKWSDIVFGMWEPYPVAMMEIFLNVRVTMSGEKINPSEGAIVIMNHRTRLDWNFLWAAFFHSAHPHAHNLKFILKSGIMHIPGPGWVMQACSFLFIHRNWEQDQKLLAASLDYLKATQRHCQILIFPEGTDLTKKSIERSNQFAEKNGLSRYYKVLHPKTTGFVFLVNKMRTNRQLQAVYDLTVGYPKTLAETELDLLKGQFPDQLHFHVKRYDVSDLPKDETELKSWLTTVWKEKEGVLHRFYNCGSFTKQDCTPDCLEQNNTNELLKSKMYDYDGHFANANGLIKTNDIPKETTDEIYHPPGNALYLATIFWTTLVLGFFYASLTSSCFQVWVTCWSIIFITLSFTTDGFHQLLAKIRKN